MLQELKKVGRKFNILLDRYQKILGRFRHAADMDGKGLFTQVYHALQHSPKIVHLNLDMKLALRDWRTLIRMLAKIVVHVRQLVTKQPKFM